MIELCQSVRVLQNPVAPAVQAAWVADARVRVRDLDLGALELELARMGTTDAPIGELSGRVRAYWRQALAPYWDRIRTALEGDVLCRAQQAANGGIRALLGDIDCSVRYHDAQLILEQSWSGTVELRGRGLLLVPSVFAWSAVAVIDERLRQPTLIYPARGSGLVWEPPDPPPEALAALIGARRASVLALLETPASTTDLAQRLGVGPASVSQHLAVLHTAGLIERHRVGRIVLYRRSAGGNYLLGANGHSRGRSELLGPGRAAA